MIGQLIQNIVRIQDKDYIWKKTSSKQTVIKVVRNVKKTEAFDFDRKIMNLSDIDTRTIFICRQFLTKTLQKEYSHINFVKITPQWQFS